MTRTIFIFMFIISTLAFINAEEKLNPKIYTFWDAMGKQGHFAGVDSVEIQYRAFKQPNKQKAVVIASGRTESMLKYKEVVYDLMKKGYSVYVYDHRGQGLSGRMLPNTHKGYVKRFDHYVKDLTTFVDTVVKPNKHKKLFLLAHSMGGAVSSLYLENISAQKNPFTAAILCSPMHAPGTGFIPKSALRMAADVKSLFGRETKYVAGKGNYKEEEFKPTNGYTHSKVRYDVFVTDVFKTKAVLGGPTWKWLNEAIKAGRNAVYNAGRIKIPVLLIQAGGDKVVEASAQKNFFKKLKAKNCEMLVIADAYHELFIESDLYRNKALNKIFSFMKSFE